jgi:hypothetical protein
MNMNESKPNCGWNESAPIYPPGCVVKVCAEGTWYRATVVEHRPDISIVMVQLDSGENVNVWPEDVKPSNDPSSPTAADGNGGAERKH